MTHGSYWLFLPACFAINMAFGPNNVLSLSNGARAGVRISVAASTGRLVAFCAMIFVAAIGLGALLMASKALFTALKLGGAAYLVWLGIRLLRAKTFDSPVSAPREVVNTHPAREELRRLTRQEFLVAVGNPKAILVFTAFFPQFVDRSHYAASFIQLGLTFIALELLAITLYALLGASLGRSANLWIRLTWLNRASGCMMIGFGMMLSLMRRTAAK